MKTTTFNPFARITEHNEPKASNLNHATEEKPTTKKQSTIQDWNIFDEFRDKVRNVKSIMKNELADLWY